MTYAASATLPSQRALFDIPEDVAYFNCAYMSPLAHRVVAAGEAGVRRKRRPWEISPADFFDAVELARERFAQLINADPEGIAMAPAASYAIATAARNLPVAAGQRIVLLGEQFPSNVYVWIERARAVGAEIVTVALPDSPLNQEGWTQTIASHVDERTAVVALAHCHWTDGRLVDLAWIGRRCREVGAALVLDLTQSAGALPFDCQAVQPDFIACASYKWLMGPYAGGFTYVAPRWREGEALEANWIGRAGANDFAALVDYRDDYQPGARRFDVGERSNFALVPMMNEALAMLLEWGVERIASTLGARTERIARQAGDLGLRALPRADRAAHFLGLRLPASVDAAGLPARLAKAKVHVSVRGRSVRITPHVYNTDADEAHLLEVLAEALAELAG